MWKLNPDDKNAEIYYQTLVLPKIQKMFENDGSLNEAYRKANSIKSPFKDTILVKNLSLSIFKELIVSRPKKIAHLNKKILEKVFQTNNIHSYLDRIKRIEKEESQIKREKKKGRTPVELTEIKSTLLKHHRKELEAISLLFDYEMVIVNGGGYDFARMLNLNTCTYCNRIYTLTVTRNGKKVGVRPQFDHWFPKSIYPLLSLSYYNLIPSCNLCNSSLKGQTDFSLKKYIHPYLIKNVGFNFRFEPKDLKRWDFKLSIVINDDYKKSVQNKIEQTLTLFALREVSDAHSSFELKDIMDKVPDYDTTYVEGLFEVVKDIRPSKEDIYRCIFGTALLPSNHSNRPFSKMTYDILDQLDLLESLNLVKHRKKRKVKLIFP